MQVLLDNLPLLFVASVFAPLSAWFAARRSRHPGIWFVFGALLGPVAMGLIAIAPPGRCPSCAEPVHGWVTTCAHCGRPLGGPWGPDMSDAVMAPADAPVVAVEGARRRRAKAPVAAVEGTRRRSAKAPVTAVEGTRHRSPDAPDAAVDGTQRRPAEVVSTGIYLSGNAGLEIGACYALARLPAPDGDRFRVFGPVDTGQITVRHERLLTDLEITVLNERVIISGRHDRSMPTFVFQAIGGMRGEDLERAFAPVPLSPP